MQWVLAWMNKTLSQGLQSGMMTPPVQRGSIPYPEPSRDHFWGLPVEVDGEVARCMTPYSDPHDGDHLFERVILT